MRQRSDVSSSGEECSNVLWLYESNLLSGYEWVLGHDGSDAGISTYAYFNPDTGVGYVLLTNADMDGKGSVDETSNAIGSHLMSVFDTPSPPPPPPPSPSPSPSGCPGGSLQACIALCPSDPAAFQACMKVCQARCKSETF